MILSSQVNTIFLEKEPHSPWVWICQSRPSGQETRPLGVIIGALVIGFAISALELVCTGQVYLPTITFVIGVEGMRVNALTYLILYNLMFVTPLLVVFGFVYWGTTSVQLGGVLQRHLMPVKVGTGVLLLTFGAWLLLGFYEF